jgi:hypothetical protein
MSFDEINFEIVVVGEGKHSPLCSYHSLEGTYISNIHAKLSQLVGLFSPENNIKVRSACQVVPLSNFILSDCHLL